MKKIVRLVLSGFRGATCPVTINFDSSKPVTLIFGENGTGKSTIADALDFVCNRHFGSLEDRSMAGQPKSHVASVGHKPSDVKVLLSTTDGDFAAVLGKEGPTVTPCLGCPEARVLRRSNLLLLVNAQPKQRFEELKAFITVLGIERAEAALRQCVADEEKAFNDATRSYGQAITELERLWTAEGKPGKDALQWAETEAAKNLSELESAVKSIEQLTKAFLNCENALCSLNSAKAELETARNLLTIAVEEQRQAESRQSAQNADILKLLQDAELYISGHKDARACPVCETPVDRSALLKRLGTRIHEMRAIAVAAKSVADALKVFESKSAVTDQAKLQFCFHASTLGSLLRSCALREVSELPVKWSEYEAVLVCQQPPTPVSEGKLRELWGEVLPCRDPLAKRKESDLRSINQRNAIKGHYDTHKEKCVDARGKEELVKRLKLGLEVVARERKVYVEGILAAIAEEVESIYTRLHPGEGIGKIRFYLKPRAIGSLEFDGQFQTETGVPPQAYYSDSHLDMLGICVFLALAKHFRTEDTIVVLDDVVTSVDGPHLNRFMKLLHDEAPAFNQVIVTTHYRPWRDSYRWARGPAASTQVHELGPWTLANGLQAGEFTTAVDELRSAFTVSPIDRQAVASKSGIVLESLLDFLTLRYRCAVPRNVRNEYTLGDLAAGVDSRLGKELRCRRPAKPGDPKSDVQLKALIEAATCSTWVRNSVGCHFSSLGSEITDGEVLQFCQCVLNLADALICPFCASLPTRRPSGSHWECRCNELELYPLVYPGRDPKTVDDEF